MKFFFKGEIKRKKAIKNHFKKRDLKSMPLGIGLSIVEGPERTKDEKGEKIKKIAEKIDFILKMSVIQYLNYLKGKNQKKEGNFDEDTLSTIPKKEERLENFGILLRKNKKIKYYNLKFNF